MTVKKYPNYFGYFFVNTGVIFKAKLRHTAQYFINISKVIDMKIKE